MLTVQVACVAPVVPAAYRVSYGSVSGSLWIEHDNVVQLCDLVVPRVSTKLVSHMVSIHHHHQHHHIYIPKYAQLYSL